jgi:hypothetical protein
MKILHISDGSIYNYDGVSTYINELLECASKAGTESMVLTTVPFNPSKHRKANHKAEVKEFRRIKFLSNDKFNFSIPVGMKKAIHKFDPDLIWIHTIGPIGINAALISRKKYRTIYTKHCFDGELWISHLGISPPFQWIYHMVANLVERIILKSSDSVFIHLDNMEKIRSNKYFNRFRYVPPTISEKFL